MRHCFASIFSVSYVTRSPAVRMHSMLSSRVNVNTSHDHITPAGSACLLLLQTDADAVIDTEAQMKKAKDAMEEDDRELLTGSRTKAGAAGGAAAAGGGAGPSTSAEELVPAKVDLGLLKEMEEMGFPTNRAIRALHFAGSGTCNTVHLTSSHPSPNHLPYTTTLWTPW